MRGEEVWRGEEGGDEKGRGGGRRNRSGDEGRNRIRRGR